MAEIFTEVGVIGKLDEKVRVTCNYEIFLVIAKYIICAIMNITINYSINYII